MTVPPDPGPPSRPAAPRSAASRPVAPGPAAPFRIPPVPAAGTPGFTLIEMIVVLVVLGLVGSIVLSRGPLRSPILDLRAGARVMAAAMRGARAQAVDADHDVTFTIDADHRDYGVRGGARRPLPAGLELAGKPEPVVFHPDGSASGGAVTLAENGRQLVIRVDWLTGAVTLR